MSTLIYNFGDNTADGGAELKHLLGGKGANLGEMSRLGCLSLGIYHYDRRLSGSCQRWGMGRWTGRQLETSIRLLEERTGRQFGSVTIHSWYRFVLVHLFQCRMMDTILNLGLNDETVEGLAAQTGNSRFAYDAYRRFVKCLEMLYWDSLCAVQPRRDRLQKGKRMQTSL